MKVYKLLLLVSLAAIIGCKKEVSNNVDQDKIWTSYELFYNENVDKTYAIAVFHFSSGNGTILELSDPSNVKFNNTEMPFNTSNGKYEMEFSGLMANGIFAWEDTEGNLYTNTIEIREVGFGSLQDTIYKDMLNTVDWTGGSIDTNETIVLTIDGSSETDAREFPNDTIGQSTLVIDSLKLLQVTSGDVVLSLDRKYLPDLQEETERGGKLLGRYRTIDRTVFLADSIQ